MFWLSMVFIGSFFGCTAVIAGAFGAHLLKESLGEKFEVYQLAVQYQLVHALFLLCIAFVANQVDTSWVKMSGVVTSLGILFFSGSLYLLCFRSIRWLGFVTPLGGLFLVLGWAFLFLASLKLLVR